MNHTPTHVQERNGTEAIVLGWGVTEYDEQLPENQWEAVDALRSAVLPIIDRADCARMYANVTRRRVSRKQLCAGLDRGGVDACSGDSGVCVFFLWGKHTLSYTTTIRIDRRI